MRKGVFAVALLCLAAALLPACQPTPEEEIVVQQGEAADAPAGPVLAELLPLPERVDRPEQTLGVGGVACAAEVAAPEAGACPVVEVRQAPFTAERLRVLAETFCPGATLYHSWEPTQEELLEQRAALLEYGDDSEDAQIKLKWLDETIPTAPLTVERHPFSWDEVPEETFLSVRALDGADQVVCAFQFGAQTFVYFRNPERIISPQTLFTEQEFARFPEPAITEDTALAEAMEVLPLLGLSPEDMQVVKADGFVARYSTIPVGSGYEITFAPAYEKLPGIWAESYSLNDAVPPSIAAPWPAESLRIYVDVDGVAQVSWKNPSVFGAVLEQDAALLPFEQMLERAEQQLLYLYAADGLPGGGQTDAGEIRTRIEVTRISLVRGCIQLRDERDVGQSVPLWRFDYLEHYGEDADPLEHVLYLDARTGAYVEPRMDMETLMQLTS